MQRTTNAVGLRGYVAEETIKVLTVAVKEHIKTVLRKAVYCTRMQSMEALSAERRSLADKEVPSSENASPKPSPATATVSSVQRDIQPSQGANEMRSSGPMLLTARDLMQTLDVYAEDLGPKDHVWVQWQRFLHSASVAGPDTHPQRHDRIAATMDAWREHMRSPPTALSQGMSHRKDSSRTPLASGGADSSTASGAASSGTKGKRGGGSGARKSKAKSSAQKKNATSAQSMHLALQQQQQQHQLQQQQRHQQAALLQKAHQQVAAVAAATHAGQPAHAQICHPPGLNHGVSRNMPSHIHIPVAAARQHVPLYAQQGAVHHAQQARALAQAQAHPQSRAPAPSHPAPVSGGIRILSHGSQRNTGMPLVDSLHAMPQYTIPVSHALYPNTHVAHTIAATATNQHTVGTSVPPQRHAPNGYPAAVSYPHHLQLAAQQQHHQQPHQHHYHHQQQQQQQQQQRQGL
uniref:Uncharacterized protein n=2 Tax=Rhizochromulina marina TaxID=1034831 RepID=A0A7S2RA07_9STRA|mmetsp:Transcript_1326/g.4106  ORF Transcript_1326/g.4106 Transcript_1326/m.4106 type:complete len:462 (+) Transcript_1326:645-2030(+)